MVDQSKEKRLQRYVYVNFHTGTKHVSLPTLTTDRIQNQWRQLDQKLSPCSSPLPYKPRPWWWERRTRNGTLRLSANQKEKGEQKSRRTRKQQLTNMWPAKRVIPIPRGAKKVARCFSTAKKRTERIKAQVAKHSINKPWPRFVPAPKAGVTARGPGSRALRRAQATRKKGRKNEMCFQGHTIKRDLPIAPLNWENAYRTKRVGEMTPIRSKAKDTFLDYHHHHHCKLIVAIIIDRFRVMKVWEMMRQMSSRSIHRIKENGEERNVKKQWITNGLKAAPVAR